MNTPPSYETISGTVTNKTSNRLWCVTVHLWIIEKLESSSVLVRETWYRRLIELNFNQDEATAYAALFVQNEVIIDMIPELNDSILKSMGIEKAGQ